MPGRAQDGRLRLRRQGAGRASPRADDADAAWAARRRPARRCSRRSSTSSARSRWSPRAGSTAPFAALRRRSRTATAATSSTCRSRPRRCRRRVAPRGGARSPAAVLEALDVVGVLCVEFFLTPRRPAARQRAGPAAAQLRPPDLRRLRHQPVRAAAARRLRPAAGLDRAAAPGGDGQPARRPVERRRARLGRGLPLARREAAPLRQGRAAPGPQDGTPDRAGRDGGGGRAAGARRARAARAGRGAPILEEAAGRRRAAHEARRHRSRP